MPIHAIFLKQPVEIPIVKSTLTYDQSYGALAFDQADNQWLEE